MKKKKLDVSKEVIEEMRKKLTAETPTMEITNKKVRIGLGSESVEWDYKVVGKTPGGCVQVITDEKNLMEYCLINKATLKISKPVKSANSVDEIFSRIN